MGIKDWGTGLHVDSNAPTTSARMRWPEPTTNGFIVSGDSTVYCNGNGSTYKYLALVAV